jgi:hypothetical protein
MQKRLDERRIGVEIEFSNLPLEPSARVVTELFGGTVQKISRYDYRVSGTVWGDFSLELDTKLLKKLATDPTFTKFSRIFGDDDTLGDFIESTASTVVPYEIATPAIPIPQLYEIDRLVEQLRLHGALGTTRAFQYAFGVHLNIEPPALDAETVLRHFQAFLMMQPWLERQTEVNITRRMSPFIDSFDESYVYRIMAPTYRPDREQLIRDYIDYQPSRNMVLDLLPLFAYWERDLVFSLLPDEKINPRPAFHYRLPNSKVDLLRWRVSDEWSLWRVVELLAEERKQFRLLQVAFIRHLADLFGDDDSWIERCHQCALDLLSR